MLTNRARLFLRKLKAQEGMQVPYLNPDDQFKDYYSIANTPIDESTIQPNFQAAQERATKGIFNFTPGQVQMSEDFGLGSYLDAQGNVQQRKGSYEISEKIGKMNIPFLSNWTKSVVGMYDFFESFKDKKKQEAYERNSQADLKRRKEEARANSFYMTPYTSGRTDKLTRKLGGKVYQQGGDIMDSFMDYYNQQQEKSLNSIQQLQQGYEERNRQLEQEWKNRKTQGFAQWQGAGAASFAEYWKTFGGGMGGGMSAQQGGYVPTVTEDKGIISTATPVLPKVDSLEEEFRLSEIGRVATLPEDMTNDQRVMLKKIALGADPEKMVVGKPKTKFRFREKQDGGEIDTESLYSPNFVSPYEQDEQASQQLQDKIYTDNPGMSYENKDSLMKWLFEEQPLQTYTVNDIYNQQYGQQQGQEDLLKGDIATVHLNPGNIKYGNFAAKYGAIPGRRATDGGVFAKFPTVEAGLQAQKDLLTSGSYANLTVADAMRRWSNSGYGADLYPQVANKKMKDLTPQELNELILRQTKRESPTIYKKIYERNL